MKHHETSRNHDLAVLLFIWGSLMGNHELGTALKTLRSPTAEGGVDRGAASGGSERRQWAAVAVAPARRTWELHLQHGGHGGHGSHGGVLRVFASWITLDNPKIELKWTEHMIYIYIHMLYVCICYMYIQYIECRNGFIH
jgi:hypothetical protein